MTVVNLVPTDAWRMGGPGGQQRLIPDPATGELRPYQRVSTFAKTLDRVGGLDSWKQWIAVRGAKQLPDLAAEICRKQSTPHALLRQLHEAGGGNVAADRGTARHQIIASALTGAPVPDMSSEHRTELNSVLEVIGGLGTVVAVEAATVCDEYEVAGSCDLVLRASDGQLIVADLKTGKVVDRLACSIQLIAHARAHYYDLTVERRGELVAPTPPRLVVVHAPQTGAYPTVIDLPLDDAKRAAALALEVRDLRRHFQRSERT